MRQSTLEKWWPVTHDYGLIRAPVETVLDARLKAYHEHGLNDCTREDLNEPLELSFRALEPLSFQHTKEIYLATRFGWTAFFQNGTRGSDPALPMLQLSKALCVQAMRVCVRPPEANYPSVIWEVYDTEENGASAHGYRRSIAAANDGGRWVFEARGVHFPFEELGRYNARRKRDRFPPQLLWQYLREMGIPPLSDDDLLFRGKAKGGILSRPKIEGARHLTLREAIAAF